MIRRFRRLLKAGHKGARAQDGQALIELAVCLPLMCLMILGAVELARVAYAAIEVANAAHAAAQYAASSHASASNFAVSSGTYSGGISNAASGDADLSNVSVSSVSLSCSCADGAHTPSSCSDNKTCENNHTGMVETVTVQTQTSFKPLITFLPYTDNNGQIKLTGYSSQVVANQ
jgi:Flp pilus assembly protein TadG